MVNGLINALADLKEKEALRIVSEKLDAGVDPIKILEEVHEAMETVSKRNRSGEYFIAELLFAGEILKGIMKMLKPKLAQAAEVKRRGKVVIGTVAGDIHDIGKNIIVFLLDVSGFEVHDLGVNVPSQKFVEKIKEVKPEIVALSGFLTPVFEEMKATVEAIEQAGLRGGVKIMIGGGVIDDRIRDYVGADAFERFAGGALSLAIQWTGGDENGKNCRGTL